jgi:hypothetical protein
MSRCEYDDFMGWGDAAIAALRQRGVAVDSYAYK